MNYLKSGIVIFMAVMIGCASIGEQKRVDLLKMLTDRYENALRWGQYETAFAMIGTDQKETGMAGPDDLKHFKVTSYRLINKSISASRDEARQRVEIRYYETNNMIEKTLIDNQIWTYDKDVGSWLLSSGLPDFK